MSSKQITLIVGERDSGKTTTLLSLLRERHLRPEQLCGFVSLANQEKTCYRLKDLFSEEARLALYVSDIPFATRLGKFTVDESAFAWANEQLLQRLPAATLAVFDELGRFELQGGGFDPSFRMALATPGLDILATVRSPFLEEVMHHYALDRYTLSCIRCQYTT
ncbi:nucleoside-triphosphatase [Sphaerochaeta sp. PS]|uniref:nucleoside-triphosphatase n=1 Tax=Sphaerochaeta sp. PS TaxID=3076336 RepID=UPI0028A4B348|nr:nucleoside-triphosphatase [Sphaerochaeta sp. PS]MDT4762855.1 nucleoside-triphosphatase [Sphaerochaeta sp. PS]